MNRRFFIAGFLLFLTACGGGSSDIVCESQYWDGNVGVCLPSGWRTVDKEQLVEKGVPEEVVTAFQAETPISGQYATVTVTEEPLEQEMTSEAYSEASVASVESLPGFERIDEQEVAIDGQTVMLHIFSAQPRADQPKVRFYQVSAVGGMTGYTFTAAMPLAIADELEDEILLIMRSATFEDPTVNETDDSDE